MRAHHLALALVLSACSSGGSAQPPPEDASSSDATADVTAADATPGADSSADSGVDATTDASADATSVADSATSGGDASDGACPTGWLLTPDVASSIAVPSDGGGVLIHASGAGSQNYVCTAGSDGGTAWTFVGPEADLSDCTGALIGHHFASDAGAGFPEWQTLDGTYVVGHKLAAYTPDGGSESVPWLLLQAVDHGGTGTLSQVAYVQRLNTDGGVAPTTGCDAGDAIQVPYGADYYFFGP
jgi:hypothetical protein